MNQGRSKDPGRAPELKTVHVSDKADRHDPYDRLLTEQEAIEMLGIQDRPKSCIRSLIRNQGLPAITMAKGIRRYQLRDLMDFIEQKRGSS